MKLTLSGKPLKLGVSGTESRAVDYLNSLSPKEVLTSQELAAAIGIKYKTLRSDYAGSPVLTPYKLKMPVNSTHKLVWGNPKAIKELRRQLETN